MIDLHAHSTASDGTLSPSELVELAATVGLSMIALTDHDTVAGLGEASRACAERGLRFVPGVELEVDYAGGEFHLLGLGLTGDPQRIEGELEDLRERRNRRNLGIIAKMDADGIAVDLATVTGYATGGVLARPHFARFLVDRGIARSIQDAFDRFLARGSRYYVPISRPSLEECTALVHRAGGRAIIAHPHTLGLSLQEIEGRIPRWNEAGIDGIEAYHSNADPEFCRQIESMARRSRLVVTAGSDFHGENLRNRRLGFTSGARAIEDRFGEWLGEH